MKLMLIEIRVSSCEDCMRVTNNNPVFSVLSDLLSFS